MPEVPKQAIICDVITATAAVTHGDILYLLRLNFTTRVGKHSLWEFIKDSSRI